MASEPILNDFDYFTDEPVQRGILNEWKETVRQEGSLQYGTDVSFLIKKSSAFTALHKTKLCVKVKVTKENGVACNHSDTTTPDKVSIINNLLHSMWKSIDVEINGHSVESSNNYPYRAYLDTLTSYNKEVLAVRGSTHGWSKDTAGQMQNMAVNGLNTGLKTRYKCIESSKVYSMKGRLHCDMFLQGRSIPPNNEIRITLTPAESTFVLNTPDDNKVYELHIQEIYFEVTRQTAPPSLAAATTNFLSKTARDIKCRRVNVTTHNLTKGSSKYNIDNIFQSTKQLPDRFFVALVDHHAYVGSYKLNPFDFAAHKLQSIQATLNGSELPKKPYTPDWAGGAVNEYLSLLEEFDSDETNNIIDISQKEFASGYAIYPFRVVPRCSGGDILGPVVTGAISLELEFSEPLDDVLTVLVLSEQRGLFRILDPGTVEVSAK